MSRYVKSEKGYEKSVKADWKAIEKGLKKVRGKKGELKKVPTSVALDPKLVEDLKAEAKKRDIPYQILMRMFIVEGFRKFKKSS